MMRAVDEAVAVMEENRQIPMNLPIGVAYDLGGAVVLERSSKLINGKNAELEHYVLAKLGQIVPGELRFLGKDRYNGDLSREEGISFNACEINMCGESALLVPGGSEMMDESHQDAAAGLRHDAYRNGILRSYLTAENIFVAAGGKRNEGLKIRAEAQLS